MISVLLKAEITLNVEYKESWNISECETKWFTSSNVIAGTNTLISIMLKLKNSKRRGYQAGTTLEVFKRCVELALTDMV